MSTNPLFADILMDDESLFRNEEALDFEYLPEVIPFREDQQAHIANSIKLLFHKRKSSDLFINGAPGIGKTVSVRYVFRELKDFTNDILPVYVNCWEKDTQHAIVSEIARALGYVFVEGKSTKEILTNCIEQLSKFKGVVLAFDEIDKAESHDFLYSLTNLKNLMVVLLTNRKEFLTDLDPRIKSRLAFETLNYQPYSLNETREILKQRADLAFPKGIFSKDAFDGVVNESFLKRDIRAGLFLLRESGINAERRSGKKITKEDFLKAKGKLIDFNIKPISGLRGDEKIILEIVKKNEGITSGELYRLYKVNGGELSTRSFRRYIQKLERQNLITIQKTSKGFRGQSSRIYYNNN